jgi:hypothetical protein
MDTHKQCSHGRRKVRCKECGGSEICEHGRRRNNCSLCRPELVFKMYGHKAQNRKLEFTLTLNEFKSLVIQPCFFCGEHDKPGGVDRWDNTVGYVSENCRPCCSRCNHEKGKKDGATWVDNCQRVADHTRAVELSDLQAELEEQR